MEDKRSKSIEEREEEYHKARERIFNQDVSFCGSMTGLVCDLETGGTVHLVSVFYNVKPN